MINEQGSVVDVKDSFAWVSVLRQSTCESCSVKKGCGTSVLSKVVGQKLATIKVKNTLSAKVGDQVTLSVDDGALVGGSFLIYLLPLLGMFVFSILSHYLFTHELLTILAAVLGLFGSFFLVKKYSQTEGIEDRFVAQLISINQQEQSHFSVKLMS